MKKYIVATKKPSDKPIVDVNNPNEKSFSDTKNPNKKSIADAKNPLSLDYISFTFLVFLFRPLSQESRGLYFLVRQSQKQESTDQEKYGYL